MNHINELMPVFKKMPYFMSSEFSMIDCCLAPLLWRLNTSGFTIDEENTSLLLSIEIEFLSETVFKLV